MLIALLLAAAVHHAPSRKPVAGPASPLDRVIAQARKDHFAVNSDPFAAPTAPAAVEGMPFRIKLPVRRDMGFGSHDPMWTYKEGTLWLTLNPWAYDYRQPDYSGKPFYVERIDIRSDCKDGRAYVGQNGFGASRNVSVLRCRTDSIVVDDDFVDRLRANDTPGISKSRAEVGLKLDPVEAKKIANDVQLLIEGQLVNLKTGRLAQCHTMGDKATIDDPTEWSNEICFAGAKVTRIAYVRPTTGSVVAEWKADAN